MKVKHQQKVTYFFMRRTTSTNVRKTYLSSFVNPPAGALNFLRPYFEYLTVSHFQPCLIFESKAGAYPSGVTLLAIKY
jgi:hypothetical protein